MVSLEEEGWVGIIREMPIGMIEGVRGPQVIVEVDEVRQEFIIELCAGYV